MLKKLATVLYTIHVTIQFLTEDYFLTWFLSDLPKTLYHRVSRDMNCNQTVHNSTV